MESASSNPGKTKAVEFSDPPLREPPLTHSFTTRSPTLTLSPHRYLAAVLPMELFARIIELSCPISDLTIPWSTRSTTLTTLSVVSRSFCAIAQPLLFSSPFVSSNVGLGRLANTLAERRDLAKSVRDLQVDLQFVQQGLRRREIRSGNLKRVMGYAKDVRQATIAGNYSEQDLLNFADDLLPKLQRLELRSAYFSVVTPFISHSLVYLCLEQIWFQFPTNLGKATLDSVLTPSNFPSLRVFAQREQTGRFNKFLEAFGPQLLYLSMRSFDAVIWPEGVTGPETIFNVDWASVDMLHTHNYDPDERLPFKYLRTAAPLEKESLPGSLLRVLSQDSLWQNLSFDTVERIYVPFELEDEDGKLAELVERRGISLIVEEENDGSTVFFPADFERQISKLIPC